MRIEPFSQHDRAMHQLVLTSLEHYFGSDEVEHTCTVCEAAKVVVDTFGTDDIMLYMRVVKTEQQVKPAPLDDDDLLPPD